ncbi:carboxymuconolactone decarboxylase family protein [Photobacterium galatheae]|uniref:Carboxymuconolactone decarboxylase n=1 Tax=Photobacterium galatheae TaxID=1654360 RepID=A0A066RT81_9GAMM|nr:carboxymuconolactone decarboxylase family protein [Photobacterium galatheae]KDM93564.1 carboxymuconolactone decarboxylase [Photobacterium galatheae]MCM0151387.1 carboxymuconolactone decarboxylase family protein [Photobacterium galatheae]
MGKTLDKDSLGKIAPKLAELTTNTLFGDLWQREALTFRERSLITVSALVAMNKYEQLRWHINFARENGLTEEDIVEVFTHLAFYVGWPSAVTALQTLNDGDE